MLSADKITREEFDEVLGRYQALVKGISTSKPGSLQPVDILKVDSDTMGSKGQSRLT